ncbi:hypothetical protein AB0K43_17235 [Kitasatospora sp. NPDC049258]|uniref:hypothetical protein n=1 Tax=Kitasatospora sp. NPDC049258 TaxID=3155394 RepID=UPI003437D5A5
MTRLILTVRPSLVAKPFHLAFTRPVVEIDGTETETTWGTTEFTLGTGHHEIAVAFRYRGTHKAKLARARHELTTAEGGAEVRLTAQLGARNGSSFTITES